MVVPPPPPQADSAVKDNAVSIEILFVFMLSLYV
jgi:hypothetical protein